MNRITQYLDPQADDVVSYVVADEQPTPDAFTFDGRHFDPTVGQWMSEDPIGHAGDDENLRRYVGE